MSWWARGWIDGAGEENDSSHIVIKETWRAHAHPTGPLPFILLIDDAMV
jgi:hypothetical protein